MEEREGTDLSELLDDPTLIHVLEYLEAPDLCVGVGLVCRRWRTAMKRCALWFRIYRAVRIKPVEWKHVPGDEFGVQCGSTWDEGTIRAMKIHDRKVLKWAATYSTPMPLPVHSRYERCNHGKCMKPRFPIYSTNPNNHDGPVVMSYCCNTWHWKKHRFSVVEKLPHKDYHREFVKDALAVSSYQCYKRMMNVHPVRGSPEYKRKDLVAKSNKYLKRYEQMNLLQERTDKLCKTRESLFPECKRKRKGHEEGDTRVPKKSKRETSALLKYMNV